MGEQFGSYELKRQINSGEITETYDASDPTQTDPEQRVLLDRGAVSEDEAVDSIWEPLERLRGLQHHNIARISEFGVEGGYAFVAIDAPPGASLAELIERGIAAKGVLPIPLAVYIAAAAAAGIQHAQSQDVTHSALSPSNILIGMNGTIRVARFVTLEQQLAKLRSLQVKGQFQYMAPEQIEDSAQDARSNVFALGVILYELVTRTTLFSGDNDIEIIRKVATLPIETPSTVKPDVDTSLSDIIMTALNRDPELRYQDARELQTALVTWLSEHAAQTADAHLAAYMMRMFPDRVVTDDFVVDQTKPIIMTPEMFDKIDSGESLEKLAHADDEPPPSLHDANEDDPLLRTTAEIDMLTEGLADLRSSTADEVEHAEPEAPAEPTNDFAADAPSTPTLDLAALPLPSMNGDILPPATATYSKPDASNETPTQSPNRDVEQKTVLLDPPDESEDERTQTPGRVAGEPETVLLDQDAPNNAPETRPPGPRRTGPPHMTPHPGPPRPATAPAAAPPQAARPAPVDVDVVDHDVEVDWRAAKSSRGWVALLVFLLAAGAIAGFIYVAMNSESDLVKQAEESTRNKELAAEVVEAPPLQTSPIDITTTPEAAIVINGLLVKGAPMLVNDVDNEIVAYAPGHAPRRVIVSGKPGESMQLELNPLELEPDVDLKVVSDPPNATVYIDGKEAGATPVTVKLSGRIEHHIWIETDEHFGYAGFVSLVPGAENLVDAKLYPTKSARRNYVEAKFRAIPRGTLVELDGKRIATTPSFKNLPRNTHKTITFSGSELNPMTRHVSFAEVGTFELRPFLQKVVRQKGTISVAFPKDCDLYIGANQYSPKEAKKIELQEGIRKVVADCPSGRLPTQIEIFPATHTEYQLDVSGSKATLQKL